MADDIARLGIRIDSLEAKVADLRLKELDRTSNKLEQSNTSLGASFRSLIVPLASLVSVTAGLNKAIAEGRNLAIFNASLKTATGSVEGAAAAFQQLEEFAANTPFVLGQSVDAFVKLKNLGLDPSIEALESYGNTAAAMGKDLSQMIEAVADATTGEFERLKEFGIKARSQGEQVSFTFQGVTTTIGKNAAEIEEFLRGIGDVNFAGAMADRMDTLDGKLSNLEDSWDKLFRTIMDSNVGGFIESSIGAAIIVIEDLIDLIGSDEIAVDPSALQSVDELTQATLDYAESWQKVENMRRRVAEMEASATPAAQLGIKITTNLLEEEIAVRDRLLQKMRELSDPLVTLEATVGGRGIVGTFEEDMKALQEQQNAVIELNKFRAEATKEMFDDEMQAMQDHQAEVIRLYKERDAVVRQSTQFSLNAARSLGDGMLEIMRRDGREQTAAAKSIFLAQKAIDVAQIISATEVAAAKAAAVAAAGGPVSFFATAGAIRAFGYANAALVAGLGVHSAANLGAGGGSASGVGATTPAPAAVQGDFRPDIREPQPTTNVFQIQIGDRVIDEIVVEGVQRGIDNQNVVLQTESGEWVRVSRG